jgi:hypothetical protein
VGVQPFATFCSALSPPYTPRAHQLYPWTLNQLEVPSILYGQIIQKEQMTKSKVDLILIDQQKNRMLRNSNKLIGHLSKNCVFLAGWKLIIHWSVNLLNSRTKLIQRFKQSSSNLIAMLLSEPSRL